MLPSFLLGMGRFFVPLLNPPEGQSEACYSPSSQGLSRFLQMWEETHILLLLATSLTLSSSNTERGFFVKEQNDGRRDPILPFVLSAFSAHPEVSVAAFIARFWQQILPEAPLSFD